MIGAQLNEDTLTLYGSFTSSSSYKPMLYLALAGLPFSFRTVNLKTGVKILPNTWRSIGGESCRHCSTAD
jgi:glutathione S-transferase